jgi:hypothetical protein
MASAELSRRVGKVVAYPPLSEMSEDQRRDFTRRCSSQSLPTSRISERPSGKMQQRGDLGAGRSSSAAITSASRCRAPSPDSALKIGRISRGQEPVLVLAGVPEALPEEASPVRAEAFCKPNAV